MSALPTIFVSQWLISANVKPLASAAGLDPVVACILGIFGISLLISLLSVPVAKRLAVSFQLVDLPDQKRKLHQTAIPLIGGIVIFFSVIWSVFLALGLFSTWLSRIPIDWIGLMGLLIASTIILLVGIIDDRYAIRGRQKLLGQVVAAAVLIAFGYRFESITVFGTELDLSFFSLLVVFGWILVGINSVNLLDGADGFASTIGFLMSVALCIMALHLGRAADALILAAAAGAILGFLRYNFPPATAYLGDAGSMLIGLFVSAMAIRCASKEAATYAFLAPIALLAIPMVDTVAALIRRRLTGRSVFAVDRGHLHHALIRKGYGPRKALLMFFGMCLMTATGGTLSLVYRQAEYAFISIAAVVLFLFVGKVFGIAEFQLIANRSAALVRSFVIFPQRNPRLSSHQVSVRLQGDKNWDACWQALRDFAQTCKLQRMTMDLNLPWLHESFHAKYHQLDRNSLDDELWSSEVPLVSDDRVIGRLYLEGEIHESSFFEVVTVLFQVLEKLQPILRDTIASVTPTLESDDEYASIQSLEFGAGSGKKAVAGHAADLR